ncbi:MAG TPA: ABC transporter permease [Candidatus Saccharimonadales bacterium]|nr:ABC transporter permease [Candidatus Saccharimonadales bacterium]
MRSLTRGNFKTAWQIIRGVKWRSFLTMLGVIIGVASVITVVSIGEGVKNQVGGQINQLGKDLLTIRPGNINVNSSSLAGINLLSGIGSSGSLQNNDIKIVTQTKGVKTAVPLSIVTGKVRADLPDSQAIVLGTTQDLPEVLNHDVQYGAFFSSSDYGDNVAIIGSSIAQRMFNENVPLGRTLTINGQAFMVRGILDQFDIPPLSIYADFNNAIFIPYQTAEDMTNNTSPIYEILAKPSNAAQTQMVQSAVVANLKKAHGGQQNFTVLQQKESLSATNKILNLLTALIGGVAAISLLVGGIGIMNVMLVSVTERMHEIGIRKAVGATNRQILNQFVVESTVLTLTGGIIGVILALFADVALRLATSLEPVINWQITVVAVLISIAVGILFGSIPALKAARKDPIDALRNE